MDNKELSPQKNRSDFKGNPTRLQLDPKVESESYPIAPTPEQQKIKTFPDKGPQKFSSLLEKQIVS